MNCIPEMWMGAEPAQAPQFWFDTEMREVCCNAAPVEIALGGSEAPYQALFENSRDAICVADASTGCILQVNRATEKLLNRPRIELIGLHYSVLHPPGEDEKYAAEFARHVRGETSYINAEVYTRDGRRIPVEITSSLVQMPNGVWTLQGFFRDITDRQMSEAAIHWLACYDPLTQLPNRWQFLDQLSSVLIADERNDRYGAVLIIDLDNFKRLNYACGHAIGDALLKEVAARLTGILRTEDSLARFGGDEFAVLLPNLASSIRLAAWFARTVTDKIHQAIAVPFPSPVGEYLPSASIGVTLFPQATGSDLIKQAETAMYRARETHCETACFFEATMQAAVEARFALESDLRHAVEKDELRLFLQPQVNGYGRVVGAEALLRWEHPQRGLVVPADFIPLAEETGLILRIGDWVLLETCRAAVRLAVDPVPVSRTPRIAHSR